MNVIVVSSKFPPEYSGSGLRIYKTYQRLHDKYGTKYKILTSSVTSNKNTTYMFNGIPVNLISWKPFHSSLLLNYKSKYLRFNYLVNFLGKIFYRFDFFVEAFFTFIFHFRLRKWTNLIHVIGNVNVTAATLIFAKIYNKEIIYEVVNFKNNEDYNPLDYYEPFFIKWFYGKGFKEKWQVITISMALKKLCENHNSNLNIFHRPNPVDDTKFYPVSKSKKYKLRKNFTSFSTDDYVICNISKFMPLKNQIILVNALQVLPIQYKLLMVGPIVNSGPLAIRDEQYLLNIKQLVASLGLQDRVIIKTGFFNNVDEYYQLSDVFAFPTTDEALGTPMLECLSCAVPVVMTDIKGVSDTWIDNGINGYLCTLSISDIAEKILLSEKLDRQTLIIKSKKLMELVSVDVIDAQYQSFFNNLSK
jgi:glycosyltransferase involved in cell wall biosynthesis